jgi:hypothetical protein
MTAFSFADWFVAWRKALGNPARFAHGAEWQLDLRHQVVSALSDASAEQLLNPLVASHLRHYGARWAIENGYKEKTFWVRSEWAKADLSYGLAEPFDGPSRDWDKAWLDGKTGDVGQCEVKVLYAHYGESKVEHKLKKLEWQLKTRRDVDRTWQKRTPQVLQHLFDQQYHGLIWMFEHKNEPGTLESIQLQTRLPDTLELIGGPTPPADSDILIGTWPDAAGKQYAARLDLALVKLK